MKRKYKLFTAAALLAVIAVLGVMGGMYRIGPLTILNDVPKMLMKGNAEEYRMRHVEPMQNSPLQGKNVIFLGSSVTYGAFSLQEGIPEYYAARMGCNAIKEAVSGTTLADNGKDSYVQRLLKNVDPAIPCSLFICQLSTNDAHQKMPLGEIANGFDRASFDTATTTGAMEFIISYAKDTWNCPVMFYTNCRFPSNTYPDMIAQIKELQEKWGIGLLNLWDDDDFNTIPDAQRKLWMADDVHPTMAGYRDWWCPELERQTLSCLH